MQIILILFLLGLLTDCSSVSRPKQSEEKYSPVMGDRVLIRDEFYSKCKFFVIEKRPDFTYLLKRYCPFKDDEIVVNRSEIVEKYEW